MSVVRGRTKRKFAIAAPAAASRRRAAHRAHCSSNGSFAISSAVTAKPRPSNAARSRQRASGRGRTVRAEARARAPQTRGARGGGGGGGGWRRPPHLASVSRRQMACAGRPRRAGRRRSRTRRAAHEHPRAPRACGRPRSTPASPPPARAAPHAARGCTLEAAARAALPHLRFARRRGVGSSQRLRCHDRLRQPALPLASAPLGSTRPTCAAEGELMGGGRWREIRWERAGARVERRERSRARARRRHVGQQRELLAQHAEPAVGERRPPTSAQPHAQRARGRGRGRERERRAVVVGRAARPPAARTRATARHELGGGVRGRPSSRATSCPRACTASDVARRRRTTAARRTRPPAPRPARPRARPRTRARRSRSRRARRCGSRAGAPLCGSSRAAAAEFVRVPVALAGVLARREEVADAAPASGDAAPRPRPRAPLSAPTRAEVARSRPATAAASATLSASPPRERAPTTAAARAGARARPARGTPTTAAARAWRISTSVGLSGEKGLGGERALKR